MDLYRKVTRYLFPETQHPQGHSFSSLDSKTTALFHDPDFVHSYTSPQYYSIAYQHLFVQRPPNTLSYGIEIGARKSDTTEPYVTLTADDKKNYHFDLTTLPYHSYPTAPHTTLKYDQFFSDSTIRAQLTNLLDSPMDYISYELAPKQGKGTSTAKIDATGTVTLGTVVHYRGLSGGVEVSAPSDFVISEQAERRRPDVNFGLSYEKDLVDYPFALGWRTRDQAKLWTFSYLQEINKDIQVGAKFESDIHKHRDFLSGWGVAALYRAHSDWVLRAQVLPGKTAAVACQTHAVPNSIIRASVGFPLDGRSEPHFGVSATIGTQSDSLF